jgi:MFS family permease
VAEGKTKGKGALNPTVVALMTEAFLSRMSGGLVKTAVPLYALLVFGLPIAETMLLVLIQNVVPLLLRPFFGTLADRYGKKKVFMISLTLKTAVSVLYAVATLPMLFAISVVRGMADSAKGPSASAMIADNTDERHIAQAYSWYTTIKSTSGGIGEGLAAFLLLWLLVLMIGTQTVTANVAVLEGLTAQGTNKEEFITSPEDVAPDGTIAGTPADPNPQVVLGVEQREVRLGSVPIEDLPKVIDSQILRRALVVIFIVSAAFSALSLILVQFFIREKKKEKSAKKKDKPGSASLHRRAGMDTAPAQQPNVWSFALMGALLTAPAYMVTGEFFTILAVKLNVTSDALGWIKIVAETLVPLFFGPIFGWLADRFGTGKIIALRSVSNMATSLLFWITPWFAGTAMLAVMMGIARGVDEIGKAAFKPTWGAVAAKVSSFNLANRSRTMGIMEGGVDASDLTFPVVAALLFQYLSLGVLMAIRAALALIAEIYVFFLMKKYRI